MEASSGSVLLDGRKEGPGSIVKCQLHYWEGDLLQGEAPKAENSWDFDAMDGKLWSGLPWEVLDMILRLKIPSSSKCRFRAVCKDWRRLLSSPEVFTAPTNESAHSICKLGGLHVWGKEPQALIEFPREAPSGSSHRGSYQCCQLPAELSDSGTRISVGAGLICVADAGSSLTLHAAEIHVCNPMNKTWTLLPKFEAAIADVRLLGWRAQVVGNNPPDSGYYVYVTGQAEDGGWVPLVRYSSYTSSWQGFPHTVCDDGYATCEVDIGKAELRPLTPETMFILDYNNWSLSLFKMEQEDRILCVKSWLTIEFPMGIDEYCMNVVAHQGCVYLVAWLGSDFLPGNFAGVWELDVVSRTWDLVSVAPDALLSDLATGEAFVTLEDISQASDFVILAASLCIQPEEEDRRRTYYEHSAFFHLPTRSWHNEAKVFSTGPMSDWDNQFMQPRLDLFLS